MLTIDALARETAGCGMGCAKPLTDAVLEGVGLSVTSTTGLELVVCPTAVVAQYPTDDLIIGINLSQSLTFIFTNVFMMFSSRA